MQISTIDFHLGITIKTSDKGQLDGPRSETMSWEDDAFSDYEQRRNKVSDARKLATQRNQLIEDNHQNSWYVLRTLVTEKCIGISEKSGRQILKSIDPRINVLDIEREDGEHLKFDYDSKIKTVTITSEALPFVEQKYTVVVHTGPQGSDVVGWMSLDKKHIESASDITKDVITSFLRAGNLG
jgi:hypothetical protein